MTMRILQFLFLSAVIVFCAFAVQALTTNLIYLPLYGLSLLLLLLGISNSIIGYAIRFYKTRKFLILPFLAIVLIVVWIITPVFFFISGMYFSYAHMKHKLEHRVNYELLKQSGLQLIAERDKYASADVLDGQMASGETGKIIIGINGNNQILPEAIRELKPSFVYLQHDRVLIEFVGGMVYSGFEVTANGQSYLEDDTDIKSRKSIIDGLWLYSRE
jgi:hypothetical protein